MRVLLIGHGGREHALAWKLSQSSQLTALYTTGTNPAINALGTPTDLDVTDHLAVKAFCQLHGIGLVVIGPEAPLVAGLVDDLNAIGIDAFGPSKAAAQLEGSKRFTKDLCAKANIPTAAYRHFTTLDAAKTFLTTHDMPVVIKADGLAAGKGVTVATSYEEAIAALEDCFSGEFGAAGAEVVIEAFLHGEEASLFVLTDGDIALPLATAQDHKRVGEGDTGPNTGGMGAYSPAPIVTDMVLQKALDDIITPTLKALKAAGTPYRGVLYAGLMIDAGQPSLVEYNCRFGDPECQVLMARLDSDLLPLLQASAAGSLAGLEVRWSEDAALTVVMAAKGYPAAYEKGSPIVGVEQAERADDTVVFHAGTQLLHGKLVSNGGRVLSVTARGETFGEAQSKAYVAVDKIDWPDGFYRRDIGWRAMCR